MIDFFWTILGPNALNYLFWPYFGQDGKKNKMKIHYKNMNDNDFETIK